MQGTIHQINISRGGIPKLPIPDANVTSRGIDGDSWAHPHIHGGPNQALLLISLEDLANLQRQGFKTPPGALGENLTISGMNMRDIRFGDRFHAGEVLLEITKLRRPCQTLDSISPDIQTELYDSVPGSAKWGKGGFYAKVLEPGAIRRGDIIAKVDSDV
jgi:MOSC domain-containing protein YiiM